MARSKARRVASTLLIIVGIALIAVAGGIYAKQQYAYHEQDVVNDELAQNVQIADEDDPNEVCPVTVDWASLKEVNDEVVGWIYVPGTTVNYPVYQTTDNEHYLHYNAKGEWGVGGQVFMDYQNQKPGLIDGQTLIYGHHLHDGTMFTPISELDQQEKFDATPTVWYITEEGPIRCVPVFFYDTDRDDTAARTTSFASTDELHAFILDRLGRCVTRRDDAEEVINNADHFLTLSTCVYYKKYARKHGRGLLVCVPASELPSPQ